MSKRVVVVDFQHLDISCWAAEKRNRNRHAFCNLKNLGKTWQQSSFWKRGERLIVDLIVKSKTFTPKRMDQITFPPYVQVHPPTCVAAPTPVWHCRKYAVKRNRVTIPPGEQFVVYFPGHSRRWRGFMSKFKGCVPFHPRSLDHNLRKVGRVPWVWSIKVTLYCRNLMMIEIRLFTEMTPHIWRVIHLSKQKGNVC